MIHCFTCTETLYWPALSMRLFALLGAEKAHIIKSWSLIVFGSAKTQLFYKSCVLELGRKRNLNAHSLFELLLLADGELRKYPQTQHHPHRSTPTINKTHFNIWYSEHRINKTKQKITQNQHKNNLKSTQDRKSVV